MTETLIQILLVVAVIAIVILCFVLWRSFEILSDFKRSSDIIARRIEKTDAALERTTSSVESLVKTAQAFLSSFELVKILKNKFNESHKKGAKDES